MTEILQRLDVNRISRRLDAADAKGIHMSRLYLILDEHSETRPLTTAGLKLLLRSMLESHRDLSGRAFVQFDFDYYLRRDALVSENSGWNCISNSFAVSAERSSRSMAWRKSQITDTPRPLK